MGTCLLLSTQHTILHTSPLDQSSHTPDCLLRDARPGGGAHQVPACVLCLAALQHMGAFSVECVTHV